MDLNHDDFDFSNTSISQATYSHVQGAETDRGHCLKESGSSLQEDSTMINVENPKGLNSKQNNEILNRDIQSAYKNEKDDDTPQMRIEREFSPQDYQNAPSNDFIKIAEDEASEYPILNKTSSNVVQQSFKLKNGQTRQIIRTSNDSFSKRKKSTKDKRKLSSEVKGGGSVIASVKDAINNNSKNFINAGSINSSQMLRLNNAGRVHQPQIMHQPKKNPSMSNLQNLTRSIAETNLN